MSTYFALAQNCRTKRVHNIKHKHR